ncbi:MAG: ABC transporter permease, partial [Candidatus Limnocylindria bacterium]
WPAFAACALVIGVALLLPAGVLVHWVLQGVAAGEQLDAVWAWAAGSLYVSGLASVATTLAALPIALLAVRYASALARWADGAAQLSFALPGIVIALALVFFGAQYAPIVYQTVGLLVAAYVIHFLTSSLTSIRAALLSVDRSVEEAARGLGAAPLRVFLRVTLPLIMPGLLAGAAMVFLLTMKELPATLLLAPLGFKTLATSLWGFAEAAFFARTAFPALVLLLVSSIPMAVLVLRESRWMR